MAKDGTNRGGRRVRAGAKPGPLGEKLAAGRPATRLEDPLNEPFDFAEGLYDSDVPSVLDELKEHSIGEFTISVNQTGLTTIIWNLTQAGATLRGMTQVNDRYPDPITGERRMIPAWHLAID